MINGEELQQQQQIHQEKPTNEKKSDEDSVLQSQIAAPENWPSPGRFFWDCTSKFDRLVLVIAAIGAVVGGAAAPFSVVRTHSSDGLFPLPAQPAGCFGY